MSDTITTWAIAAFAALLQVLASSGSRALRVARTSQGPAAPVPATRWFALMHGARLALALQLPAGGPAGAGTGRSAYVPHWG
jgi:hypothetical protein